MHRVVVAPGHFATFALGDVSVQQVPHGHFRDAKWTPSPSVQRPWTGPTTEPPTASPTTASAAAPAAAPALR